MVFKQNDELFHVVGVQLVVVGDAFFGFDLVDDFLKGGFRKLHDDVGEHLDETAVGVIGKAGVVRQTGETLHDRIVEAEVQNGVHHARHRSARAAADADEERVVRVAEFLAAFVLHAFEIFVNLALDLIADGLAVLVVVGAGLGGDGKAVRHGHAEIHHLRQVGALAAQQLAHIARALAEHVNKFFTHRSSVSPLTQNMGDETSGQQSCFLSVENSFVQQKHIQCLDKKAFRLSNQYNIPYFTKKCKRDSAKRRIFKREERSRAPFFEYYSWVTLGWKFLTLHPKSGILLP